MSDQASKAIVTESLTKIYENRHIALNCVRLEVEAGTVLGVLGENGAGKTTFVKLLLGLQVPTAGRVYILGQRMTPNAGQLRRRIGYLPAEPKFPPRMTPIAYLNYVGKLHGLVQGVRQPRLAALLRAVDLLHASGERIEKISTGMKTRLALAASLINDPELLIWDEPARGLDPQARQSMLSLIRDLAATKTLVLCSHNLRDIESVCSRAILLHEGQLVFDGDLADLQGTARPASVDFYIAGDRKEIADAVKSIQKFEELESCTLVKNVLSVRVKNGTSHATVFANVLVTLADHHIDVADMRTMSPATEKAIVNLLAEEQSRGLTRAYQPVAG